jgi:hypothetical protein
MAGTRFAAKVGQEFDLEARFTVDGVLTNPATVSVTLYTPGLVVQEVVTPTRISTGVYRARFAAVTIGGVYRDYWFYKVTSGGANLLSAHEVTIADMAAAVNEVAPSDDEDETVCAVTHTFLTIGRVPMMGMQVTFQATGNYSGEGMSAVGEATQFSDAAGAIRLVLSRGVRGWFTVPGMDGMCREVTIPDQAEVDLLDLLATVEDHLTVTKRSWDSTLLPRRSS